MTDKYDRLSLWDRAKLKALREKWERDGALDLRHFGEQHAVAYLRIMHTIDPDAVCAALEDALIERGLTNAEFLDVLEAINKGVKQ
jgi:hypothetical protein